MFTARRTIDAPGYITAASADGREHDRHMNEHTAKAFDSDLQELTARFEWGLGEREIADSIQH